MTGNESREDFIEAGVSAPTRSRSVAVLELATLAGFSAYLFFFGLGSFGLVGADEPRYAQIAREMLSRHDWVTPTLNGVPWLEKPALLYWSAMLSYKVFGVSDWAARVPSAAFATAMVFAIFAFTRRLRGLPLDAALIAASSAAIIGFARAVSTDMPLTATFTMGMLAWYSWWESGRKLWLAVFYVMMALGTLAKGPVAPGLAGLIIAVFALVWSGSASREHGSETRGTGLRLIGETLWIPGILLFLGVALPWYIAVQLATHNFFQVFILQHNLERFGTNLYRHKQPYWYYLPVLALSVLPWTVYVVTAAVAALRQRSSWRVFLLLWIAVPVMFFTISESKLPGYILPAIPPCGMLAAEWLRTRVTERGSLGLAILHALVCGAVLSAALLAPYFIIRMHPPGKAILIAGIAAAVVAIGILASLLRQGARVLRFVTLVPVVLGMAFVLRIAAPIIDRTQSARPVAAEISTLDTRGAPLAAFNIRRELEYGLDFYRNRPLLRYERGEAPAGDHLLIARSGSESQLQPLLAGRRLLHVGSYPPQRLEFYWVASADAHLH